MRWHHLLIGTFVLALVASPALASGGLFKRAPKPDPAEQVPALIKTLKTDPDERKRADAAEDLRDYDPKSFPDMVPALIEALQNDASTSVRLEAVNTISKLRPISMPAGYALEQSEKNDPAFRVRAAAKTALVQWTLFNGYRRGSPAENRPAETDEPPLADAPAGPAITPVPKSPALPPARMAEKDNGPRVPPPLMPSSGSGSSGRRPLLPLLPTRNNKPGSKPGGDEGPSLNLPM